MSENTNDIEISEDLSDLENLPLELCVKIFDKLEYGDLMNLFLVSKRLEFLLFTFFALLKCLIYL